MLLLFLTMIQSMMIHLMILALQNCRRGRNLAEMTLFYWIAAQFLMSLMKTTMKWKQQEYLQVNQLKLRLKNEVYQQILPKINVNELKAESLVYFNYQKAKMGKVIVVGFTDVLRSILYLFAYLCTIYYHVN